MRLFLIITFLLSAIILARGLKFSPSLSELRDGLTIHIIPHSHCDVGWLETVDSYYTLNVSKILDGVYEALSKNEDRRFNWAEVVYFKQWYENQNETIHKTIQKYISDGRLEFIGGGWVQNDESTTTYTSVIQQMKLGQQYLRKTFGVVPKIGWQIDSFGSTVTTPLLLAMMGYEALIINRMPESIYNEMHNHGKMAFVWRPSPTLNYNIFTVALSNYFCSPGQLAFEPFRHGVPNYPHAPYITPDNIESITNSLLAELMPRFDSYVTKHLLVPFGCDFTFQGHYAEVMFSNAEKLIQYINQNRNITMKFSTLSEYISAIKQENPTFPVYTNDFLPYWMGFYTSRPLAKHMARIAESKLRSANILRTFVHANRLIPPSSSEIAENNNAIFLHHDAITGTSCSGYPHCIPTGQFGGNHYVVQDYYKRLNQSIENSNDVIRNSTIALLGGLDTNITNSSYLYIINTLSWTRDEIIDIPWPRNKSITLMKNQSPMDCQISSSSTISFIADLDPLSINEYELKPSSKHSCFLTNPIKTQNIKLQNLSISLKSNYISLIFDTKPNFTITYNLFESNNDDAYSLHLGFKRTISPISMWQESGPLFTKIKIIYNILNMTLTIRPMVPNIYIEHEIGTLPLNTELSMSISTFPGISKDTFTYYANGFQTLEINPSGPLKEEAYPMVNLATMGGTSCSGRCVPWQLSYITDKSQAIGYQSGSLEFLLHRRTTGRDVNRWVDLDDTQGYIGKGIISLNSNNNLNKKYAYEISNPLELIESKNKMVKSPLFSPLRGNISDGIFITSLEYNSPYFITFHNYENKSHTINLHNLFSNYNVTQIMEVSPSSLIPVPINRFAWKSQDQKGIWTIPVSNFTIHPQEIRTFKFKLSLKY